MIRVFSETQFLWGERGRNLREGYMDQNMDSLKQNTTLLFLGRRELKKAEQVKGSKMFACRFPYGSGAKGQGEPRWMEEESTLAFLVPLMCFFKDCTSNCTLTIPSYLAISRPQLLAFNLSTNLLLLYYWERETWMWETQIDCLLYVPPPGINPATQICVLTQDQTHNLQCTRWCSNQLNHLSMALQIHFYHLLLKSHSIEVFSSGRPQKDANFSLYSSEPLSTQFLPKLMQNLLILS